MSRATVQERAFTFQCRSATLVGVIHPSGEPAERGVLVVVGGPQYRVGSHRQFVLLARDLAAKGVPVMRFDHRGIGDSHEPYLGFEALDDDIAAAIDAFIAQSPGLREVVLWGLCDAASAILFYAHRDQRVAGIALLNPWVRTSQSEAQTYLRHYYLRRLFDRGFWQNVLAGRFRPRQSAVSLLGFVAQRLGLGRSQIAPTAANATRRDARPLPDRMADGLANFNGPALLILSGQDLTAREFEDAARASEVWRRLLDGPRVSRRDLPAADHTFSRRAWHDMVVEWTCEWVRGDVSSPPGDGIGGSARQGIGDRKDGKHMTSIALGLFVLFIVYIMVWSIKNDGARSTADQTGYIRMRDTPKPVDETNGRSGRRRGLAIAPHQSKRSGDRQQP